MTQCTTVAPTIRPYVNGPPPYLFGLASVSAGCGDLAAGVLEK